MIMIMIAYNVTLETDLMEILEGLDVKYWTRAPEAIGNGEKSGFHLNTPIWPKRNSLMWISVENEKAEQLMSAIRTFRESEGHEGIKAFAWPLSDVT